MGNSPSTARQLLPVDSTDTVFWDSLLQHYGFRIDAPLPSGSGRLYKSVRLAHTQRRVSCVAKPMYVPVSLDTSAQEAELQRLRECLTHCNRHVALWSVVVAPHPVRLISTWYRPITLLRPHMYTTLGDRLASRPFLDGVELLWIANQILQALHDLHSAGVVHGFVSTANVGLTSSNWVVLLDCSSVYKPFVSLPDDDPSDYLLAFHSDRCYLAPERFCKAADVVDTGSLQPQQLTPAMDIFAAGCVLVELFLNGERCMDLGDLMEYRRGNSLALQQKLAKIEHAAVRAACRHMLSVNPAERLSAKEYLERLEAQQDTVPTTLTRLSDLVERTTVEVSPDARIAMATQEYGTIVWECMGACDVEDKKDLDKMLGPDMVLVTTNDGDEIPVMPESPTSVQTMEGLLSETEELLKQLEDFSLGSDVQPVAARGPEAPAPVDKEDGPANDAAVRSIPCKKSLLIYLQLILSTIRNVQRPASKLVALQIVRRLVRHCSDDARLQRIVPVLISMLQDQDHLVRAAVIRNLTYTLSVLESFSPSDSRLFPQYIFKRVSHLLSDPSVLVRIAFAKSIGSLAESSLRFLDISHAVRLYEAVGTGTGSVTPADDAFLNNDATLFADDVAKLLDLADTTKQSEWSAGSSRSESAATAAGSVLITSTYNDELTSLHETVSRWVVHVTTDQADDSAPAKRALLDDIGRLCNFFGLEGVMSFILPQMLAFLNDRKNWELRSALFEALPFVCHVMGRAATEEFVLPCVEIGLVDLEELVVRQALTCLWRLIDMDLLSRWVIVGSEKAPGLVERYRSLLLHPSTLIRNEAFRALSTASAATSVLDCEVYIIPALRPYLRYKPTATKVATPEGLKLCVKDPLPRECYIDALREASEQMQNASAISSDKAWTSVGFKSRQNDDCVDNHDSANLEALSDNSRMNLEAMRVGLIKNYLLMLAKHTLHASSHGRTKLNSCRALLESGIVGSVKQAQSIMFPRQDSKWEVEHLPEWYSVLRDLAHTQNVVVTESATFRSISMLGQVYGLSIMGPVQGTTINIVDADDEAHDTSSYKSLASLQSIETKRIGAALQGQWGCEALLDPELCDTTFLITKLKALGVPPLSPFFGMPSVAVPPGAPHSQALRGSAKPASDWRPRMNALVATSSRYHRHTAPVVRLAVAPDSTFFVSGSHDGTCRVWETSQVEDSAGVLESSLVFSGHANSSQVRINDIALIEGSYSVVSGDSSGVVHVWRVELESSLLKGQSEAGKMHDKSRATGISTVHRLKREEGEILAVSHYNSLSASVITFASQRGFIHSLDLRSMDEPFILKHGPELGHLSSVVLGSDRNWVVSGTSQGYVSFWDVRFQKPVKLWRHSRGEPISRLGSSMATRPQDWGLSKLVGELRPTIFVASGDNECSMFDAISGVCHECFRVVKDEIRASNGYTEPLPVLTDVAIASRCSGNLFPRISDSTRIVHSPMNSINALVGSIGGSGRHSYLITGGNDGVIRYWDFAVPTKCFDVSGINHMRSSFERIDVNKEQRLMLCQQPQLTGNPRNTFQGVRSPGTLHSDSIQDLKVFENHAGSFLVSGGRDSAVKIYH